MRKHRITLWAALLILFGTNSQILWAQNEAPQGVSSAIYETMKEIVRLMNASYYDSAETIIITHLFDEELKLSDEERYYFLSYEAEVMYYNALFDLGLASANSALEIALQIGDKILIGSAYNLIGLQYIHLKKYEQARRNFAESARMLPLRTDKRFFSQRYHALANLGEVYLYLQEADSAVFYSEKAVEEALIQKVARGASFAYWSVAEGELLRNNTKLAKLAALKAFEIIDTHQVLDVRVYMSMTMVKIYLAENNMDSAMHYWNHGEWYVRNSDASEFTKHTYVDFLVKKSLELKLLDKAYEYMNWLQEMRTKTAAKQENQKLFILESLYKGKEELAQSKLQSQIQQSEIKLRGIIVGILVAMLIVLLLALYSIYRDLKNKQKLTRLSHKNQLMKQQQQMELKALETRLTAVNNERNRIASDLHDDIGAALSSIHIYSTIALNNKTNEEKIHEMLALIKNTSNKLLERMSDIIWSINPDNEKLRDLLLRMKTYTGDVLYPLGIKVEYFLVEEEGLLLNVLARKNLYLTFKEAINNIAKYSRATEVVIRVEIKNETLYFEINDNGIGFDMAKLQTGNGLKNMIRRMDDLKGEFTYVSEPGKCTQVKYYTCIANISD